MSGEASALSRLNSRVAALARVRETRVLANAATRQLSCDKALDQRSERGLVSVRDKTVQQIAVGQRTRDPRFGPLMDIAQNSLEMSVGHWIRLHEETPCVPLPYSLRSRPARHAFFGRRLNVPSCRGIPPRRQLTRKLLIEMGSRRPGSAALPFAE